MTPAPQLLSPGFTNAVLDAQASFRSVLHAMSRPGLVVPVPLTLIGPAPLDASTAAVCLTLLDADTTVWLSPDADHDAVHQWLRFHCGCPLSTDPACTDFALLIGQVDVQVLHQLAIGSDEHPDSSATAILQIDDLITGEHTTWAGPGIDGARQVAPRGLPAGFSPWWHDNHRLFPQGVDCLLTSGSDIMGLPRSTEWRP